MFRRPHLTLALLALAWLPAPARAGELEDALALARKVSEAHRSDEHRARYELLFPEARTIPRAGSVRVESRSGQFALEQSGAWLEVGDAGARVTLSSWTHVPTFAARAASKRDEGRLLEATLSPAAGRVALVACALLAGVRERPRGTVEGPGDAKDPDLSIGSDVERDDWPRLALDVDGRRAKRRGPYAELARRILEEVARGAGLARPADLLAAARRLEPDLADADAAPRAAFLLGELGCASARGALAQLTFAEARDAAAKLAVLSAQDPQPALLDASATGSWDVRSWARERLEADAATRGQWSWAVLEHEPAARTSDEAVVEALRALPPPPTEPRRARVFHLLDDARASVRIEAASALLRWDDLPRAREVLVAAARDEKTDPDAREDAVARLASILAPGDLLHALAPVLVSPDASLEVRAQVARALDRSANVAAAPALADTLESEVSRAASPRAGSPDAAATRDLRVALVQALASIASVTTQGSAEALEAAAPALATAAAVDPDDDLRALAIHAVGCLAGEGGGHAPKSYLDAEKARPTLAPAALRAAELEVAVAASTSNELDRLEAIADAACEAPLRSTLARLVRAARDARARTFVVARLRARGPAGQPALEALGER